MKVFVCLNIQAHIKTVETILAKIIWMSHIGRWAELGYLSELESDRKTDPSEKKKNLFCGPTCRTISTKPERLVKFDIEYSYMWTLPDDPGASRKCSPTPALPGVRQNLPDVKIRKKKKFFFFF